MRYSKYLMEEKIINTDGMTPVLAIIVATLGVGLLGSMMPVAYVIDKTNDVWQKVK
jgi:hypothetical protein